MSKNAPNEFAPPPGSFADTVLGGQGGAFFGNAPSDVLPTHPQAKKASAPGSAKVSLRARYKQFDLTKPDQVEELESIMTDIMNGKRYLRQERMANDKDGFTIVTLSWADAEVPAAAPSTPRVDKSGNPVKLQQQFPFPTVPDGAYPGSGTTMGPPGFSVNKDAPEKRWADAQQEE